MKIIILNVQEVNGDVFVSFQSAAGQATAKWMNSENPRVDCCYDVELDTDKSISESIAENSIKFPSTALSSQEDIVFMYGVIESVEDDGVAYLRLVPDALVMIESGDMQFFEGDYVLLKLKSSEIEVTAHG